MRGHLARETRRLLGRFSDPGRRWQYGNAAHQHISDPPALSYEQGQSRWTRRKLQGNQEGPFGSPFLLQVEVNNPPMEGQRFFLTSGIKCSTVAQFFF